MKREFITGLLPDITKEVLDQIMAEHGKGIETHKNTIATLTTERDGLQTQLTTANETIKSYEETSRVVDQTAKMLSFGLFLWTALAVTLQMPKFLGMRF